MVKNCKGCGDEIPEERLKALPDTDWCVKCAQTRVVKKRAIISGSSKGKGNELIIVDGNSHAAELKDKTEKRT